MLSSKALNNPFWGAVENHKPVHVNALCSPIEYKETATKHKPKISLNVSNT